MNGSHASALDGAPQEPRRHSAWNPVTWRLRTRIIAILLAFMAAACVVIGSVCYAAMDANLTNQVRTQLTEASHRATTFGSPRDSGQRNPDNAPNPLNAPGQAAGTLNARIVSGTFVYGGMLDKQGSTVALTDGDEKILADLTAGAPPQEVRLSQGDYLVVADTDRSDETVVTGLPMEPVHHTLDTLLVIILAVSTAALALTGLFGSFAIRRTMKPLERVSAVATEVSRVDLRSGQVPATSRVAPADARPSTEVGAVGHALNRMLENVDSALTARQASEDKMREFVADASHELRTPLAAIRGYSDLLKWTESLTPDGSKSVERIDSQSQRMASLVEDLLLLARLDEGAAPAREPVDLSELVVESVSDVQVTAPTHQWSLELPEDPVETIGDSRQLRRVVLNLLSNARKHTEDGTSITTALAVSANHREAVLTVTDNGPGIDPDFLPKIFSRFARADQARSGEVGTTGLGLAIVRAIIEAHGGAISVSSRPGRTEFEARLPISGSPLLELPKTAHFSGHSEQ